MDIFSDEEKASFSSYLDDIHDTFAKDIALIKESEKTVVVSNPDSYNYIYGNNQPAAEVAKIQQSGIYSARVKYAHDLDKFFVTEGRGDDDLNRLPIIRNKGRVRIKLPISALSYFEGVEQIQFDSGYFRPASSPSLHGLFSNPQYFTVYLEEVD